MKFEPNLATPLIFLKYGGVFVGHDLRSYDSFNVDNGKLEFSRFPAGRKISFTITEEIAKPLGGFKDIINAWALCRLALK